MGCSYIALSLPTQEPRKPKENDSESAPTSADGNPVTSQWNGIVECLNGYLNTLKENYVSSQYYTFMYFYFIFFLQRMH